MGKPRWRLDWYADDSLEWKLLIIMLLLKVAIISNLESYGNTRYNHKIFCNIPSDNVKDNVCFLILSEYANIFEMFSCSNQRLIFFFTIYVKQFVNNNSTYTMTRKTGYDANSSEIKSSDSNANVYDPCSCYLMPPLSNRNFHTKY